MYLDGTKGSFLLYLDARLKSRVSYIEWDRRIIGPIHEEQGSVNGSEENKLYNNEQFTTAQDSEFCVSIGPTTVASIGQTDDAALISTTFFISLEYVEYVDSTNLSAFLQSIISQYPSPTVLNMLVLSGPLTQDMYLTFSRGSNPTRELLLYSFSWSCLSSQETLLPHSLSRVYTAFLYYYLV